MNPIRCRKCSGQLEPIIRGQTYCFHFCRVCKLPYNDQGVPMINTRQLSSGFNPLASARAIISKTASGASPVGRTALEVFLMDGLWECYHQGLKDGVLLAYSQDVPPGEPMINKDGTIGTEGTPNGPICRTAGNSDQNK